MASLEVSVSKSKSGSFEGSVSLPGLATTKLVGKKGATSEFATKSALSSVARSVAKNLGFEGATLTEGSATTPVKKAAKTTGSTPKTATPKGDV